ncbi:4-phosphopantetheinyl transferase [Streptomyces radiopugnans]|nr:4-phosphopantetheinyl transferase [Streptomyces radiopugnans]
MLSEEERARCAAFVREADRDRYRVAHTALRLELAAVLGTDPAAVPLTREPCPLCGGPHGRPAVPGNPVHFSLSHARRRGADRPGRRSRRRRRGGVPHGRCRRGDRLRPPPARARRDRQTGVSRPPGRLRPLLDEEGGVPQGHRRLSLGEDPGTTYVGSLATPAGIPGWELTDVAAPEGYAAAVALAVPRTGEESTP